MPKLRHFPSLRLLVGAEKRAHKPLNVCVAGFDFEASMPRGLTAAEDRLLADTLREAGHNVTLLQLRGLRNEAAFVRAKAFYAELGIDLVALPAPEIPSASGELEAALAGSRAAYEWLKTQSFDLVHFTEENGRAYVSLTAKRLGMAFAETMFLVSVRSPSLSTIDDTPRLLPALTAMARTYMERKSIALADIVVSSSQYLLHWMARHGYDIPAERSFVQPSIAVVSALAKAQQSRNEDRLVRRVTELVFVCGSGRGDTPNALIFRRALSLLDQLVPVSITFMFYGERRARHVEPERGPQRNFKIETVYAQNVAQAVAYLSGEGRLALISSFTDEASSIFFGCLASRCPLIISDRGGEPEMIFEDDRPSVVCEWTPAEIAARIKLALREGVVAPRPSFDPALELDTWREALAALQESKIHWRFGDRDGHSIREDALQVHSKPNDEPLVSVCITHFNRPTKLAAAIESIRRQSYRKIEIVVVDDGSSQPEAVRYLNRLHVELAADRAGRVVWQSNRFPGAARNHGVRHSGGEFILFMDDDNVAKPNEIAMFLRVADHTGADILTCYADTFSGNGPPGADKLCERRTAIGDSVSLGLFANCFGDSNSFVRRPAFEALGGFAEDYGVGLEDQEFFVRAVLRGFKLMVVPEALYWYRISSVRVRDRHVDADAAQKRVLEAFFENVPPTLFSALQFAHDQRSKGVGPKRNWPANPILRELVVLRDILSVSASGRFDAKYYLRTNPDVATGRIDPIRHFIRQGAYEARKPNPQFNPINYIEDHPEILAADIDPLVHSIRSGHSNSAFLRVLVGLLGKAFRL